MAVNSIFQLRPEQGTPSSDIVGTFRSGMVVRRAPVSLDTFRVTCADADVAETIEGLFGGSTSDNDSDKEPLSVMTEAAAVDILIESVDTGFKVFSNNTFVRSCNGQVQTGGDEAGQPCPCADLSIDDRKAYAAKGGCKPSVQVVFRLKDAEGLGKFRFNSGSWVLLEQIQRVEAKVDASDEAIAGVLRIEQVTSKGGKAFKLPRVELAR